MYDNNKIDYETKSKLHLGVSGKIVKWNSERGFGFVKTAEVADDIFFHVNTLVGKDEISPQQNESVTVYAKYDDDKKRWSATKITSHKREQLRAEREAKEHALIRPMKDKLKWVAPVVGIWLLLVYGVSLALGTSYLLISLITLAIYALDKKYALDNTSNRIPENTLHVLAVMGGWAGALVARFLFRHKTQKQPFVQLFWVTVALNVAITIYLVLSGSLKAIGS